MIADDNKVWAPGLILFSGYVYYRYNFNFKIIIQTKLIKIQSLFSNNIILIYICHQKKILKFFLGE